MSRKVKPTRPVISSQAIAYELSPGLVKTLWLAPVLIVAIFILLWFTPLTHRYALWLSKENHPAEMLSFLSLLLGAILGLRLAWRVKAEKRKPIVWLSLAAFSFGLFLIAMEEISWGQQFLKFETPEALKEINKQEELNLHNLGQLQGTSEFFHLFLGLAGVLGIWVPLFALNSIRVPSILATWFLTITLVAAADLLVDYITAKQAGYCFMRRLSEINEMLIGIACFLYIWLLQRKFKAGSQPVAGRSAASVKTISITAKHTV